MFDFLYFRNFPPKKLQSNFEEIAPTILDNLRLYETSEIFDINDFFRWLGGQTVGESGKFLRQLYCTILDSMKQMKYVTSTTFLLRQPDGCVIGCLKKVLLTLSRATFQILS